VLSVANPLALGLPPMMAADGMFHHAFSVSKVAQVHLGIC